MSVGVNYLTSRELELGDTMLVRSPCETFEVPTATEY